MDKEKIRKRSTYRTFESFLRFVDTRPTRKEWLRWYYGLLDSNRCFGSQTNANYAKESLELLIKDRKVR